VRVKVKVTMADAFIESGAPPLAVTLHKSQLPVRETLEDIIKHATAKVQADPTNTKALLTRARALSEQGMLLRRLFVFVAVLDVVLEWSS
jgi:hypothetical protein